LLKSEMCQTKFVEKIKTHKSNVMCIHIVYTLHLIYSKHHEDDAPKKNQKTHFTLKSFHRKFYRLWDNVGKNIVHPNRPQITTQYGACVLHAG